MRMSSGYDSQLILDKVLTSTLKVKNGEAAYERDSVLFDEIQYAACDRGSYVGGRA